MRPTNTRDPAVRDHRVLFMACPGFLTVPEIKGDVGATRELTVAPAGGGCEAALALLFDQSLILVMRTYPDPDKIRTILHCEGAVIDPDPRGP